MFLVPGQSLTPQIPVLFNIALPYFNEKFKRIEWNIDIFQVASQVFQNV